jgi:hypothetical protein
MLTSSPTSSQQLSDNERIHAFLNKLAAEDDLRRSKKASLRRLSTLARPDSTTTSRHTHEGEAVITGSQFAESEWSRRLRSDRLGAGPTTSTSTSTSARTSRRVALSPCTPSDSSPPTGRSTSTGHEQPPSRVGRKASASASRARRGTPGYPPPPHLEPKAKARSSAGTQPSGRSHVAQASAGAAKPRSSPQRRARSREKHGGEPSNRPFASARQQANGTGVAGQGSTHARAREDYSEPGLKLLHEDRGLPTNVVPQLLYIAWSQFCAARYPDWSQAEVQRWTRRYADCGVYTTQQFAHAVRTRAAVKTLPASAQWRGRAFLINELIMTCSDSIFLSEELAEGLMAAIIESAEPASDPPAPAPSAAPDQGSTASGTLLPTVIQMALSTLGRLDLRPTLVRCGLTTVEKLLSAIDSEGRQRSVLDIPINVQLKGSGERPLGFELLEGLRQEVGGVPSQTSISKFPELAATPIAADMVAFGAEGSGVDGQWQRLPREIAELPGTRLSKANATSGDGDTADVLFIEGDAPIVLAVPYGGRKGSPLGSKASAEKWAGYGHALTCRRLPVLPDREPACIAVGGRIANEDGTARGWIEEATTEQSTSLVYVLDGSAARDFALDDYIVHADLQWKRRDKTHPGRFQATGKASVHLPPPEDSPDLELAQTIRERMWLTSGHTPFVVLCCLDRSKIDVTRPLGDNVREAGCEPRQLHLGARSSAAWRNYHALIELAKREMTGMSATAGNDGLVVELTVEGKYTQPYVCQLGCQLREYEIEVATRPPGAIPGGSKKLDEAAIVRTFRAFDADASGAVDLPELQAAARTFGVPMSRADAMQVMTSMGKDADGQISRPEFVKWFQSFNEEGGEGMSKIEMIKVRESLALNILYACFHFSEGVVHS